MVFGVEDSLPQGGVKVVQHPWAMDKRHKNPPFEDVSRFWLLVRHIPGQLCVDYC